MKNFTRSMLIFCIVSIIIFMTIGIIKLNNLHDFKDEEPVVEMSLGKEEIEQIYEPNPPIIIPEEEVEMDQIIDEEEPVEKLVPETHLVVQGDTLYKISQIYGVSIEDLIKWNAIENEIIYVGQVLFVVENDVGLIVEKEVPDTLNRRVFLTFDDGPTRNTHLILDILYEYQVPAVFFVVGNSISNLNDSDLILQRILYEGHYLGLHSMTHDKYILYLHESAAENFIEEMNLLQALIFEKTNHFTWLYRPPFGTFNNFTQNHIDVMKASDFNGWDWNIDSNDWSSTSVDEILENIESGLRLRHNAQNLVILFHEHNITVEALPIVIEYLKNAGFEFSPYVPTNHFMMNFLSNPDI